MEEYIGNIDLLKRKKTAFLCSQKCPAELILKSYDWALSQKNKDVAIISGFRTKIELDVLHFLLKNEVPVIMVLARTWYKRMPAYMKSLLSSNQGLIITPFNPSQKKISKLLSSKCNDYILETADEAVIGYASPGGKLEGLLKRQSNPSFITFL